MPDYIEHQPDMPAPKCTDTATPPRLIRRLVRYLATRPKRTTGTLLGQLVMSMIVFLPLLLMVFNGSEESGAWGVMLYGGYCLTLFSVLVAFRIWNWMLWPFVLFGLIYSLVILVVQDDISYHMISAVYASNNGEMLDFLRMPVAMLVVALVIAALIGGMFAARWISRHHKMQRHFGRKTASSMLGGLAIGLLLIWSWTLQDYSLSDTYPGKFIRQNIEYIEEVVQIEKKYKALKYTYDGPKADPLSPQRQTLIVVVGESARRMNWQLYGYDRPTNPKVAEWLVKYPKQTTLFKNMFGSGRVTRVSLPIMLTMADTKEFSHFYDYPSVFRMFRQAGYKTLIASAQPPTGYYEGMVNMLFEDAEVCLYMQQLKIYYPKDEDLLPHLDTFLADPAPRKLIVLHTQGSHNQYKDRYPEPYKIFQGRGELVDTYDNSVVYTDNFLNEVFIRASKQSEPVMTIYASDHGENLNDSGDRNFSHGAKGITEYEICIPMVWYANNAFAEAFPAKLQAIQKTQDTYLNHNVIAHTLCGMAGLLDKKFYQPEEDLSSGQFKARPLWFADNFKTVFPAREDPAFWKHLPPKK